jgi:HEAT repeat protein
MRYGLRLVVVVSLIATGCRGAKSAPESRDVNELEARLRDRDPGIRAKAALQLSKLGGGAAKAIPALIEALKNDDPLLRQNAALALGKIGPAARDAVPALMEALGDGEWTVRRSAVQALGEIGDAQALAAVEALARDPDSLVRKAATESAKKLQATN